MPVRTVRACACPLCQQETPHPDQAAHQRLNLLLSRLDEQQRRWVVAHEAQRIGHGGDKTLSLITGLDAKTIARGRQELAEGLSTCPEDRIRQPGGGRPLSEKNNMLEPTLLTLVEPETAGDPMTEQKWVRSSLRHIAAVLRKRAKRFIRSRSGGYYANIKTRPKSISSVWQARPILTATVSSRP